MGKVGSKFVIQEALDFRRGQRRKVGEDTQSGEWVNVGVLACLRRGHSSGTSGFATGSVGVAVCEHDGAERRTPIRRMWTVCSWRRSSAGW